MISTLKPSSSTKRSKKQKPLFNLLQHGNRTNMNATVSATSSLGSNSSVPLSSVLTNNKELAPASRRPRSKSVGKHSDQRTLARQQTFDKLCGDITPPPPLPRLPTTTVSPTPTKTKSTPTRQLRKYASTHDLQKSHQREYQEIHTTRHFPLPTSPGDSETYRKAEYLVNESGRGCDKHNDDDDDDDDDIPLAATMRRLPPSPLPRSPQRQQFYYRQQPYPVSPVTSPTRTHCPQQKQRVPYYHPHSSLLNDEQEEDDEDLVPIARLKLTDPDESSPLLMSAADKYKEKVKERLHMDHQSPSSPSTFTSHYHR